MINIVLCSHSNIILKGLELVLVDIDEVNINSQVTSNDELLKLRSDKTNSILIIDYALPNLKINKLFENTFSNNPSILVLLPSIDLEDDRLIELLSYGVKGFIDLNIDKNNLIKAIVKINEGELWVCRRILSKTITKFVSAASNSLRIPQISSLTYREQEILKLLIDGNKNKQIANALYITESTVKTHLLHIFRKLGVHKRHQIGRNKS